MSKCHLRPGLHVDKPASEGLTLESTPAPRAPRKAKLEKAQEMETGVQLRGAGAPMHISGDHLVGAPPPHNLPGQSREAIQQHPQPLVPSRKASARSYTH